MGVVEDMAKARADYEHGDWAAAVDIWSDVEPSEMTADDLRAAGQAAYLLGRRAASVEFHQRAFAHYQWVGDAAGALRCCFDLAMGFGSEGEHALEGGWTTRAERLLDDLGDGAVEHGYVSLLHMYRCLGSGDLTAASEEAERVTAVGRQCRDPDLIALGLCSEGRLAIYAGRCSQGLKLLDESMTGAAAGELSPVAFGHVYCTVIEGCQEISDFGRVSEWTAALHRWCATQPGLVAFTGQCSLHRGQVLRMRGAWPEALEEFDSAIERYRRADSLVAIGLAEYERGDVLRQRGDLDSAESAYRRSSEQGFDPQPGLAMLWLARGSIDSAVDAVRRMVAEATDPVAQCRLLPSAVDILVAGGSLDEARVVAAQLGALAAQVGNDAVRAQAAFASASVDLAVGDAARALSCLRRVRRLWSHVRSPYEDARVRVLAGRALALTGDLASARQEWEVARLTFHSLGAQPAEEEVQRLLGAEHRPAGLTPREVEVLRHVASGDSNAQIAAALVLSEKTVARHLSNIFVKLEVGSRTAAAAYAFEHGLA